MGIQPLSNSEPANTQGNAASAHGRDRWEYLTFTYNYSYGATTYVVNGEKAINLKNTPLHDALTQFGQVGWELVSISEGVFVLKRRGVRSANGDTPAK